MLLRIIFTLFLAMLLWFGLQLLWRIYRLFSSIRVIAKHAQKQAYGQPNQSQKMDHKVMVQCSKCQLYILDHEAIVYKGKPYCCPEHVASSN